MALKYLFIFIAMTNTNSRLYIYVTAWPLTCLTKATRNFNENIETMVEIIPQIFITSTSTEHTLLNGTMGIHSLLRVIYITVVEDPLGETRYKTTGI